MFFRSLSLLACTLFCGVAVRAQEIVASPASAPITEAPVDDLKEINGLYTRALFDEMIYKINEKIAALPEKERANPNPHLLYLRGMGYKGLGRLDAARTDLLAACWDGKRGYNITEALAHLDRVRALTPPNLKEIREGERVLFRMHCFGMEGGAASVLGMLPNAYRISRQMFGTDVEATSVYVFDTFEQFDSYYKEDSGGKNVKLGSWIWALGYGDIVLICLQNPEGESVSLNNRQYFLDTIIHEFNHVMFTRLMGYSAQPRWFREGLAQVAEAQNAPKYDGAKTQILRRLFARNLLVSYDDLEDYDKFNVQVEAGLALRKDGQESQAPDPYTQGYSMGLYLLNHISTPQLQSFLNRVRESDDFKASFKAEFGFSDEQFYQAWKADGAHQFAAQ